jgi:prepilin-type N-terminal cleavage/methylation domain-containing protein
VKPGITLIELLVVIALVGIMAGVGWPNLSGWNCKQETRNDFEALNNIFEDARVEAINRSRSILVRGTKKLPAQGGQYGAFLLDTKTCNANATNQSLANFIPNVTISIKTKISGPSGQCFHSNGTSTSTEPTKLYEVQRTCKEKKLTFRSIIFGATGLIEKMVSRDVNKIFEDL